jgi:succinate dehydrogenase / fumarate reductase iron-sulfur subunit
MAWQVQFRVFRSSRGEVPAHYDPFTVEIKPDETVLDGIERIWAFQDRTLTFRHACHHASCGSCAMRVNGVEKLSCVTYIQDVTTDGGTLVVEPLRNFPIVGDLVVDVSPMFHRMHEVGMPIIRSAEPLGKPESFNRFENCIECGMCVSACPVMLTSDQYLGPAALAAAQRTIAEPRGVDVRSIWQLADDENSVWRCHTAFECGEVCPSNVDPAGAIMALRRRLILERIKSLFGRGILARQRGG